LFISLGVNGIYVYSYLYSVFKDFTGFSREAFNVKKPTVPQAIKRAKIPAARKGNQCRSL
jgi:hypothetical protein